MQLMSCFSHSWWYLRRRWGYLLGKEEPAYNLFWPHVYGETPTLPTLYNDTPNKHTKTRKRPELGGTQTRSLMLGRKVPGCSLLFPRKCQGAWSQNFVSSLNPISPPHFPHPFSLSRTSGFSASTTSKASTWVQKLKGVQPRQQSIGSAPPNWRSPPFALWDLARGSLHEPVQNAVQTSLKSPHIFHFPTTPSS